MDLRDLDKCYTLVSSPHTRGDGPEFGQPLIELFL